MSRQALLLVGLFAITFIGYLGWRLADDTVTRQPVQSSPPETAQIPVTARSPSAPPRQPASPSSEAFALTAPTTAIATGRGATVSVSNLERLVAGDPVSIFIPQEATVRAGQVERISITASGNRVLTGHLDDGRFVFTVGSKQTFGTFFTPDGGYQMQAEAGIGRIVAQSTIRAGLDFSQPDYVIRTPGETP